MKTALVVIDVQNGFVKDGTRDLPAKIRAHIEATKYDAVYFTKFVNSLTSNFVKVHRWAKMFEHPEIDIAPELAMIAQTSPMFTKDGWSAFSCPAFSPYLKKHGITKLVLCGMDLEGCVLATAFEAFDRKYDYEILFGLCGSGTGEEMFTMAKAIAEKNFVHLDAEKATENLTIEEK